MNIKSSNIVPAVNRVSEITLGYSLNSNSLGNGVLNMEKSMFDDSSSSESSSAPRRRSGRFVAKSRAQYHGSEKRLKTLQEQLSELEHAAAVGYYTTYGPKGKEIRKRLFGPDYFDLSAKIIKIKVELASTRDERDELKEKYETVCKDNIESFSQLLSNTKASIQEKKETRLLNKLKSKIVSAPLKGSPDQLIVLKGFAEGNDLVQLRAGLKKLSGTHVPVKVDLSVILSGLRSWDPQVSARPVF